MKVKYSHLKLDEVKQVRGDSLLDVPGTMLEDTILVLRALPCLVADGLLIYYTLRLNDTIFPNICSLIGQFTARTTDADEIILTQYVPCMMIYFIVLVAFICLSVMALNTIFMFLLKKHIPIATPCMEQNNRNRKFYNETEHILRDLITEDEVRQCLGLMEDVEIYLKDNTLEFHKKRDGYTQKIDVELSGRLKAHLESSGVLDFTYLDNEWEKALAEKERTNNGNG